MVRSASRRNMTIGPSAPAGAASSRLHSKTPFLDSPLTRPRPFRNAGTGRRLAGTLPLSKPFIFGDPVRVVYRCGAILDVPFASNGWGHAGARRPSGNAHGAFRRSGPMGAQLIGWPTTPTVRASCRRKSAIFTYVRRSRPWGSRIGTPRVTRTRRTVLGSTDKASPTATSDQPER